MAQCCSFFIVFAMFFPLLLAGAVLLLHGTIAKNKWGINLERPQCPRCKADLRSFRAPKTLKQALWGGWSCQSCGCEMDKWGREI